MKTALALQAGDVIGTGIVVVVCSGGSTGGIVVIVCSGGSTIDDFFVVEEEASAVEAHARSHLRCLGAGSCKAGGLRPQAAATKRVEAANDGSRC